MTEEIKPKEPQEPIEVKVPENFDEDHVVQRMKHSDTFTKLIAGLKDKPQGSKIAVQFVKNAPPNLPSESK